MTKHVFHIVILDPRYAETHYNWLRDFVFKRTVEEDIRYFFGCFSYELCEGQFFNFEISDKTGNKPSGGKNILLPVYSIAGIYLDQKAKNKMGFSFDESN